MPRYRVTCTDGSVSWVDAPNEAGVRRHMGHPQTVYMKGSLEPVPGGIVVETDPHAPWPAPGRPTPSVVVGEAVGPVVPTPEAET